MQQSRHEQLRIVVSEDEITQWVLAQTDLELRQGYRIRLTNAYNELGALHLKFDLVEDGKPPF